MKIAAAFGRCLLVALAVFAGRAFANDLSQPVTLVATDPASEPAPACS